MTNAIALSLCMPTYNFGKYIGETLESIVSQLTDEVEVVILDGASTDNTTEVVRQFQSGRTNVRYFRLNQRGGIDSDIAKSVALAQGDYCWLFSSDDVMRPGSIAKMLKQITLGYDLYLCKHTNCTLDMALVGIHPVLKSKIETVFNLGDKLDRQRYFELAENTEAFFSFMSGIVVKRSKWNSIPERGDFLVSCWGHVVRIFDSMSDGLLVKYIPDELLDRRDGNDSFSEKGVVNRIRIAIDGYFNIGDYFFGRNSLEAFHIRRVVRAEYKLKLFLYAKWLCRKYPDREDKALLDKLARRMFLSDKTTYGMLNYLTYVILPAWGGGGARRLYKWICTTYRKRQME